MIFYFLIFGQGPPQTLETCIKISKMGSKYYFLLVKVILKGLSCANRGSQLEEECPDSGGLFCFQNQGSHYLVYPESGGHNFWVYPGLVWC